MADKIHEIVVASSNGQYKARLKTTRIYLNNVHYEQAVYAYTDIPVRGQGHFTALWAQYLMHVRSAKVPGIGWVSVPRISCSRHRYLEWCARFKLVVVLNTDDIILWVLPSARQQFTDSDKAELIKAFYAYVNLIIR